MIDREEDEKTEPNGFNPYTATEEEGNTEHGNDERIRVEEVRRGPQILFDVVAAVANFAN